AIRAAVAAGVNITYKILYNDAVAMTGGQPIDGSLTIDDLIHQLRGEGVRRIALVSDNPEDWRGQFNAIPGFSLSHRDDYDALMRELREFKGTSVIVYQQTCAAEKRRRRKKGQMRHADRRVFINEDVCEGCGDCSVESNCLSVLPKQTALGRKREIDQSACNHDFSCLKGFCPSFVSVIGGELRKPAQTESSEALFDPLPTPNLPTLDQPWNTVVAGVGGTGVLTITSLIAMAAHIEGKGCATLNQTGLAQKFGSVVSHVRVAKAQRDIKAVRIPAGEADLLIGCDLVVSTGYEAMGKVAHGRTHAVVNDNEQPTAAFVQDPDAHFPAEGMRQKVTAEVGDQLEFVHASDIALKLIGDAIGTNLFLLGHAWQRGWVPVSETALEQAIELNGVAVDFNKRAFLLGRRFAHQPQLVESLLPNTTSGADTPLTLDQVIEDRFTRLIAYQSVSYARRYHDQVDAVRKIDSDADAEDSLTRVVAQQLFKLMAYKDEYEVARLYTDGSFQARLTAQFKGNFSLRFHLAPPLLSRADPQTGKVKKREFGPWLMPLFRLLAKLKWLRGTRLDIFALTTERKQEREDLARYEADLTEICARLTADNYAAAQALAKLPEKLRGYGHVKARNRNALLASRSQRLSEFRGEIQYVEIKHKNAA
ncbi:MAG: indolepyruvate ferredoxin oxidoreductase family protein, partial [Luminiphilus sp.]